MAAHFENLPTADFLISHFVPVGWIGVAEFASIQGACVSLIAVLGIAEITQHIYCLFLGERSWLLPQLIEQRQAYSDANTSEADEYPCEVGHWRSLRKGVKRKPKERGRALQQVGS
jgi:hypothetical protein